MRVVLLPQGVISLPFKQVYVFYLSGTPNISNSLRLKEKLSYLYVLGCCCPFWPTTDAAGAAPELTGGPSG